eukprot:440584_1
MNSTLLAHIIFSIILGFISITSLVIIWQIFVYLCWCKNKNNPKQTKRQNDLSTITSTSNSVNSSNYDSETTPASCETSSNIKVHPFFRHTTLICVSFFCIVCFAVNIDRIMWAVYTNQQLAVFGYLIWTSYFLGRMLLSLIFVGRLYFTFQNTPFKYSKCKVNGLKFCWFGMPLCAVIALVCIPVARIVGIMFGALFILIDIVLSFILLYLYLKQLFVLVSYGRDETLIALMTRYALLYTISFISTFIIFILTSLSQSIKEKVE